LITDLVGYLSFKKLRRRLQRCGTPSSGLLEHGALDLAHPFLQSVLGLVVRVGSDGWE